MEMCVTLPTPKTKNTSADELHTAVRMEMVKAANLMDSRIGRESRCPYNGFEAPFDESIKAELKKKYFALEGRDDEQG